MKKQNENTNNNASNTETNNEPRDNRRAIIKTMGSVESATFGHGKQWEDNGVHDARA